MPTPKISRNADCPCGSGKKFKRCCYLRSFVAGMPNHRSVAGDGASLKLADRQQIELKGITRVGIAYTFEDASCRAEVNYSYHAGTLIILEDGSAMPADSVRTGMRFRLEIGGVATVTNVEAPKLWQPPPAKPDEHGNYIRRVVGRVKYTGFLPRIDLHISGETIKTTPGHLFWSETRREWLPADALMKGELLRDRQGFPCALEWKSESRFEFTELYGLEVEELHTLFVGKKAAWTHNGLEGGCRVPKAAIQEAVESGELSVTKAAGAGATRPQRHHVFPPAEREWFRQRGVNIDRYTLPLDEGTHGALHYGGGPGKGGGFWNNEIMGRLLAQGATAGRQLTPREILFTGAQMRRQFAPEVKAIPYRAP